MEDGFYVASQDNKLLGFVDRISDGMFHVCDSSSQQLGLFTTLEAAQACLTARLREEYSSAIGGTGRSEH